MYFHIKTEIRIEWNGMCFTKKKEWNRTELEKFSQKRKELNGMEHVFKKTCLNRTDEIFAYTYQIYL